jgi:hypothetical protein
MAAEDAVTGLSRWRPRIVGDTRRVDALPREYIALPGGGIRQVYSIEGTDGSVVLGDHRAWLASRAARCACGAVCLGSGRTCGAPECISSLDRC